jgi:hypothetical protein
MKDNKTAAAATNEARVVPLDAGVSHLLNAGRAMGQPIRESGHETCVLAPGADGGWHLEILPKEIEDPLPGHIRQYVRLDEAESFASYVKRFQRTETTLLAKLPTNAGTSDAEIRAIFDYHLGSREDQDSHRASRMAHVAVYPCPFSIEWKTWMNIHGKGLRQNDFIDFMEENARDVVTPSAATLLELGMNFSSKTEVNFQSRVDRKTGGLVLNYSEEVNNRDTPGRLEVPDQLLLRIPVFQGGELMDQGARISWVPRDGKLSITVKLYRPEETVLKAFSLVRSEIKEATGREILIGSI